MARRLPVLPDRDLRGGRPVRRVPQGGPAGFSPGCSMNTTIAIPDRAGNKRLDGFVNILSNPHVGLLFLVPGRDDTLRINGRARLIRDAPFLDDMIVRGNRPRLALRSRWKRSSPTAPRRSCAPSSGISRPGTPGYCPRWPA